MEERPTVTQHLTLDQLTQLQDEAKTIKISEDFIDKYGEVWDMLAGRGIVISDRRRVQILKFLKAWAIVLGDDELVPEHMHDSLVHIVYQNIEDRETIVEVLEQIIPTADKVFADAKRAAAGIMTEYNLNANKLHSRGISDLNDFVVQLRKYHKDMNTVKEKINEILDGTKYRMNLRSRQSGVKLQKQLESWCETLTVAISDISK